MEKPWTYAWTRGRRLLPEPSSPWYSCPSPEPPQRTAQPRWPGHTAEQARPAGSTLSAPITASLGSPASTQGLTLTRGLSSPSGQQGHKGGSRGVTLLLLGRSQPPTCLPPAPGCFLGSVAALSSSPSPSVAEAQSSGLGCVSSHLHSLSRGFLPCRVYC